MRFFRALSASLVLILAAARSDGQTVSRAEALAIAETFVHYTWHARPVHVRHGKDSNGVEVHTPDLGGGRAHPPPEAWVVNRENTGVPYKWGGFDTPRKFEAGLKAGKAAGDLYTPEKRRLGGAAVSGDAVGIDCSGFVSRCWKLTTKHSTSSLASVSRPLASPAELKAADVMNTPNGHVLLFVRWLDASKSRALFYEAAPFSKTRASELDIAGLSSAGYQPLRYRGIRER